VAAARRRGAGVGAGGFFVEEEDAGAEGEEPAGKTKLESRNWNSEEWARRGRSKLEIRNLKIAKRKSPPLPTGVGKDGAHTDLKEGPNWIGPPG